MSETFVSRFAKRGRRKIERDINGVNEYRVQNAALGGGWISNTTNRCVFTSDDGRAIDLTEWEEVKVGRLKHLIGRKRKLTAEDADYQSFLLKDGSAHEFRVEYEEVAEDVSDKR